MTNEIKEIDEKIEQIIAKLIENNTVLSLIKENYNRRIERIEEKLDKNNPADLKEDIRLIQEEIRVISQKIDTVYWKVAVISGTIATLSSLVLGFVLSKIG